jgi:hypothetical protein
LGGWAGAAVVEEEEEEEERWWCVFVTLLTLEQKISFKNGRF